MQPQSGGKFRPRLNVGERPIANRYRESQRVLEIFGREADGGRRFFPVGCGAEQSGGDVSTCFCYARGDVAALIVVCSTRLTACLGICVLRASTCGLPIRPILKHGPRSLTCVRVNGTDKGCWSIKTAGRWTWKLKSAKECVTTHLPNQLVPKMDGAEARDLYPAVGARARPQ
ncbi:hypothetical protein YC2023_072344 [Brassica napus]